MLEYYLSIITYFYTSHSFWNFYDLRYNSCQLMAARNQAMYTSSHNLNLSTMHTAHTDFSWHYWVAAGTCWLPLLKSALAAVQHCRCTHTFFTLFALDQHTGSLYICVTSRRVLESLDSTANQCQALERAQFSSLNWSVALGCLFISQIRQDCVTNYGHCMLLRVTVTNTYYCYYLRVIDLDQHSPWLLW